jgi:arabinogalactan endo-1,4-beta-galactosidase
MKSHCPILVGAALTLAVGCGSTIADDSATESVLSDRRRPADLIVNAIPGISDDFIKGADVSMLAQIEAKGGKFYDEDGREKDCLRILKKHGVNWVRLRLWNAPVFAHGFTPEPGYPVVAGESAGGINDLARDVGLARRAKALGMKVLLDFHYSDWWADPQKQFPPQAWEQMTFEQMKSALHAFTRDAIAQMKAAGAGPDMVQIGNEVRNGMLWPLGWVDPTNASTFGNFAGFLREGVQAVREVDPSILVMIHLDRGGDNALSRRFFGTLIAAGVDFDVIGLSYYPSWHGTMDDLWTNLIDISQYFEKPVVVAETAYPWTTENADSQGNSVSGADMVTAGPYRPTVQGQATFVRDLMEILSGVPDRLGLGIFYWEPDWIAVDGAGWYTRGGDGWDNQALFDHDGKALPSLNVFRAVSEHRPWVEVTPVSVPEPAGIVAKRGVPVALPDSVGVFFSDDSLHQLFVVWDPFPASAWNALGSTRLAGHIPAAPALDVGLTITISQLANAGIEEGTTTSVPGWTVTSSGSVAELGSFAKDVHSGSRAFHWWNGTAFSFAIEQTVSGLEAGKTYAFALYAMGNSGQAMTAYAYCPDNAGTRAEQTFTLNGWTADPLQWLHPTITGLSTSTGSCRVGVTSSASAGDWGSVDDFSVTEE